MARPDASEWPDSAADAIAAVIAAYDDDDEGLSAILGNCDAPEVARAQAELMAALLADLGVCPACFRRWASAQVPGLGEVSSDG